MEPDDTPGFDEYDLKWLMAYAALAWALVLGATVPFLL